MPNERNDRKCFTNNPVRYKKLSSFWNKMKAIRYCFWWCEWFVEKLGKIFILLEYPFDKKDFPILHFLSFVVCSTHLFLYVIWVVVQSVHQHSPDIRYLCLMKCPSECFKIHIPFFCNVPLKFFFFRFSFCVIL